MNKEFIKEMQSKLLAEKKRLQGELSAFARPDKNNEGNYDTQLPEYGTHEDENASEVATFVDNLSLEHTLERNLADVLRALQRIEQDAYGVCKYCQQPIDERRLRARPESGSCIACKNKFLQK